MRIEMLSSIPDCKYAIMMLRNINYRNSVGKPILFGVFISYYVVKGFSDLYSYSQQKWVIAVSNISIWHISHSVAMICKFLLSHFFTKLLETETLACHHLVVAQIIENIKLYKFID